MMALAVRVPTPGTRVSTSACSLAMAARSTSGGASANTGQTQSGTSGAVVRFLRQSYCPFARVSVTLTSGRSSPLQNQRKPSPG
jgi:hypothetical protein